MHCKSSSHFFCKNIVAFWGIAPPNFNGNSNIALIKEFVSFEQAGLWSGSQ